MSAISGARCAFAGCQRVLFVEKGHQREFIGEIGHIISDKPKGPRYDPSYPRNLLHAPQNLLVLCPNHHSEVDKLDSTWMPDELREMKEAHESRILNEKSWLPWQTKSFWMVSYANLPRLHWLATIFGSKPRFPIWEETSGFGRSGPIVSLLIAIEELVADIKARAVPLNRLGSVKTVIPGTLIQFDTRIRTKNLSSRNYGDEHLTGDIWKDPYIYTSHGRGQRVMLPYDPKWITTSTAWAEFHSGTTRMGGICQAKGIEVSLAGRDTLVASPLVLGAIAPSPISSELTI